MTVNELAVALAMWVATTAGYEYQTPPPIKVVDAKQLDQKCEARAIYRFDKIIVGLEGKWDLDESSYLIHEIVHHYQQQQGRRNTRGMNTKGVSALYRATEVEANILQNIYRIEHGLSPRDTLAMASGSLNIMRSGKCH